MLSHLHEKIEHARRLTEVKKSREGEGSVFLYAVSGLQSLYAANELSG